MPLRQRALLLALLPFVLLFAAACDAPAPSPTDAAPQPTSTVGSPNATQPARPTAAPTSTAVAIPPAEQRITVETRKATNYYLVYGTSSQQIVDYVLAHGPQTEDDVRGIGLAEPTPTLTWQPETRSGACIISSMTLGMVVTVTLPRHAQIDQLTPDLRTLWNALAEHVGWHEQRHVDIFFEGIEELRREMMALEPRRDGCSALRTEVERLWDRGIDRITPRQEAFHAQEDARHAALREELRAKYMAGDGRIAALAQQITAADGRIRTLEGQLAATETQLATLSTQLDDIRRVYGDGALPAPAFNLYESVRTNYNNLIVSSRTTYEKYQSEVAGRNALANEHDKLVSARNGLVDAYNLAP